MYNRTAATSPQPVNNLYSVQRNPGRNAEESTQPVLNDQRTASPIVSQVSRPTSQFSAAVGGQPIASGITATNTRAATTTTTTNTTTTTTTTTTSPTYSSRQPSTRNRSESKPASSEQALQNPADRRSLLDALNRLSSQTAILGTAEALHLKFPDLREDLFHFTFRYLAYLPAESVATAFAEAEIICSDEQKFLSISNCSDPESLAVLLDAVDEQFVLKYIRQLRLEPQPGPVMYDILLQRDPEFQALLTQSTFSDADIQELSCALAAAEPKTESENS